MKLVLFMSDRDRICVCIGCPSFFRMLRSSLIRCVFLIFVLFISVIW